MARLDVYPTPGQSEIDGQRYVMLTQAIATVPRRELRHSVASLVQHHDVVLRALDVLLTGI